MDVEKNDLLLIQDEVYKVVGDYSDVNTPLRYDLEHIENEDDEMLITEKQMTENLKANNSKEVKY